ncbi:MAG: TolC family protein [Tunicatimonas sp.]
MQLAWQNSPENKILLRDADIARIQVSKAKTDWLNSIRVAGNLNEYSTRRLIDDLGGTAGDEQLVNNFFPIYNFGITLPLGIFFDNPKNTKIATHELEKAQEDINAKKLDLRAAVLAQYQEFLMNRELLEIQNSMTENQYASYQLAEQQFEDNTIPLEEYEEALVAYNTQRMNTIRAQKEFLTSKILLEQFIGMELRDVR